MDSVHLLDSASFTQNAVVSDKYFWLCTETNTGICYRWRRLKAQMIEKRSKLGESQTLQQFSRDVDEIEAWISEKLQTASDESYKDPTNIQVTNCSIDGKVEGGTANMCTLSV